jgi:hypothetical protein
MTGVILAETGRPAEVSSKVKGKGEKKETIGGGLYEKSLCRAAS